MNSVVYLSSLNFYTFSSVLWSGYTEATCLAVLEQLPLPFSCWTRALLSWIPCSVPRFLVIPHPFWITGGFQAPFKLQKSWHWTQILLLHRDSSLLISLIQQLARYWLNFVRFPFFWAFLYSFDWNDFLGLSFRSHQNFIFCGIPNRTILSVLLVQTSFVHKWNFDLTFFFYHSLL